MSNPASQKAKELRTLILEAAARGYCIAENSHKELDSTLLEAVVDEIMMVLPQSNGPDRDAVLEEAMDACRAEHLNFPEGGEDDAYDQAITDCVCAIKALKNVAPQSAGADGMKLVPQSAVSLAWSLIKERRDALFVSVRLLEEYEEALKKLSRAGFNDHLPTLMELRGILKDDPSGATDSGVKG